MHRTRPLLPLLLAAAAFASGCASTVRIQSEPAGARIRWRGEGRATFRWKDAPAPAPTTIEDVYYGRITAYAIWPDGTQSRPTEIVLSNWRDPDPVVLRPDPSLPRLAGAAASAPTGPGARPAGYRSSPAFDRKSVEKGDARAKLPPPKLELPPPPAED